MEIKDLLELAWNNGFDVAESYHTTEIKNTDFEDWFKDNKVKLNLNLVTGSIGENTKGTLTEMTVSEFEENGDPCRLCIFNTVYGASKMCHKCLKENKQTQYYL